MMVRVARLAYCRDTEITLHQSHKSYSKQVADLCIRDATVGDAA